MKPSRDAARVVHLSARTTRGDTAAVTDAARAIRVAGQVVPPGEERVVAIGLPGRADAAEAIPAWVMAGVQPGPRVAVIGAPRGFEVAPARAAVRLRSMLDPSALQGGVVVVPVFRPGGRFAARGNPVPDAAAWRFPGSPGGSRRDREAFAAFSELAVGSAVVLVLTAADPGMATPLIVQGDLDDPRARRLSVHARAEAAVHVKPMPGSLSAAAVELGAVVLELRGPADDPTDRLLTDALLGLLATAGVCAPRAASLVAGAAPAPAIVTRSTMVRAPVGGFLEQVAAPGALVERGGLLARVVPPALGRSLEVRAPHDGLVLQATTRAGIRARAALFVIGRLSGAAIARRRKRDLRDGAGAHRLAESPGARLIAASGAGVVGEPAPLRVGWVERVSLPSLGVDRLRAKIDTGARTSALHVSRMTAVGTTDGPNHRTILELTLPAGARRGAPAATVRVQVRDYVQVKDTSGRTERRPVIETTLRLGSLERRIRVTLTNRGDMLFPLLIGRTALGSGVVVDPARRLLLRPAPPVPFQGRAHAKSIKGISNSGVES